MKLFEKLETLMAAATFAEEGDRRTALEIASEIPASARSRELGGTLPGNLAVNTGSGK
jgi:hypothetical protein